MFSQAYIESALYRNSKITEDLVALFHTRLDPAFNGDRQTATEELMESITSALDAVASLDEDRILRAFLHAIEGTTRTNFYQKTPAGTSKIYLSYKFDPAKIPELPEPRPAHEIFVYSPQVEGVHLRGGSVARGGLRWSDRRDSSNPVRLSSPGAALDSFKCLIVHLSIIQPTSRPHNS